MDLRSNVTQSLRKTLLRSRAWWATLSSCRPRMQTSVCRDPRRRRSRGQSWSRLFEETTERRKERKKRKIKRRRQTWGVSPPQRRQGGSSLWRKQSWAVESTPRPPGLRFKAERLILASDSSASRQLATAVGPVQTSGVAAAAHQQWIRL